MSGPTLPKNLDSLYLLHRIEILTEQVASLDVSSAGSIGLTGSYPDVVQSENVRETAPYQQYWATHGAIGHTPEGRGVAEGNHWFDYGATTAGAVMYGPYIGLDPGAYEFWFDIKFKISSCGAADDRVLFYVDAARNVGHTIPDSARVGKWNWFCNSPYTTHQSGESVYDAWIGSSFAIAEPANQVEMRLMNRQVNSSSLNMQILVRRLLFKKKG